MAFTVQIVDEAGDSHTLTGGTTTNFVQMTGVGTPRVQRDVEMATSSHVHIDTGFQLLPRRIDITLYISDSSASTADGTRDTISQIFMPTGNPLNLKITRQDASVRQIDVYLDGQIDYPVSIEGRVGELTQLLTIPLVAPDPTWYDPTQQTETVDLSSGSGSAVISASGLTWHDYPIIEVDGPITGLNINPSDFSSSNLLLTGSTIASGRTYTFDLRPNVKTVEDDLGADKISEITTNTISNMHSNLRIHDEKYLDAFGGGATSTTIAFSGTSPSGTTEARVKYYKRYLSL